MSGSRSITALIDGLGRSSRKNKDRTWQRLSPHIYKPLSSPGEIRILRLEPGSWDDPIRCSLIPMHLDTHPLFEAISYVWGPETPRRAVNCDGRRREVQQNLFDALLIFRYPNRPRYLWADAICINQQDNQEKGSQVQLMARIYSDSAKVLIWLGHECPMTIQTAFDYTCRMTNQDRPRLLREKRLVDHQHCRNLLEAEEPTSYYWKGQKVAIYDQGEVQGFRLDDMIEEPFFSAIVRLFSTAYFRRGWVIQEVVLSHTAEVFWGHGQIELVWIGVIAAYLWGNHMTTFMTKQEAWSGIEAFNRIFYLYGTQQKAQYPFLEIFWLTRSAFFSNPLDRIYGVLALAPSRSDQFEGDSVIQPLYGISVLQCYQKMAEQFLIQEQDLSILSAVQHIRDIDPDWPSWVPDWRKSTSPDSTWPSYDELELTNNKEGATVSKVGYAGHECISLRGIRVAIVDRITGGGAWRENDEHLQLLFNGLDGRYDSSYVAWAATMGKNLGDDLADNEQDATNHYKLYLSFVSWDFTSTPSPNSGNLVVDWSSEECKSAFRFRTRVRDVLTGRSFFESKDGLLGVGPDIMQPGDVVVVFFGGEVPFILRPAANGLWRLVGECYVDDLLVGQALRDWKKSGEPAEDFYIF